MHMGRIPGATCVAVDIPHNGVPGATWILAWVAFPGADEAAKRQRWVEARPRQLLL